MSYFALFCIKAALPNIAVRVFGFYPAVCLFFFFVCVSASVAGFTALFCISRLICLDAFLVYIIYWPLACYLSASVAVLCACKASVATYASLAVRLRTPRWRTSSFVLTVFFLFVFVSVSQVFTSRAFSPFVFSQMFFLAPCGPSSTWSRTPPYDVWPIIYQKSFLVPEQTALP